KAGAFKYRGATNAVQSLSETEAKRGVVTHSSGNHAGALSLAARVRGIPAYIVMPSSTPQIKQDAVRGYGGQITICEPTLAARESTAAAVQSRTGAVMIHPFDNDAVIAGQGTAAVELLEEVPELDAILAPVGGGGLLSGTAIAARALRPGMKVVGCEPQLADDAAESFRTGKIAPARPPRSVGDGLLTSLCERTFGYIRANVNQIALASDEEMLAAMRLVLQRMKILIEPSCGVALAVLLNGATAFQGKKVGVIISGGNVEISRLV
ncbi:MAG TPA: pyridoxal-phosphate dependent enzyme, partial [Tepidisphaeraceae bacterium]|nr:pyridoxal-phosphate dependent enzyme [Tepidisphaeraceae bacterium]